MVSLAILVSLLACTAWAAETGAQLERKLDARDHAFPKVGPYEVLTGDFHMHTIHSDGNRTTRQRVEESYELGYDVIAVTDHGKTRAYTVARYVGTPLGMVVLRGIEVGMAGKEHINVVGFSSLHQPASRWSETPGGDTVFYQDELRKIASCGGFVMYNHPHVGFREPLDWGVREGLIQGIEVENDVVGEGWNT
ncbi:MAG: PHP domain-containing protein, partial [Candidatus Omnitrophica bacterium]|nr:PHP domain-containing protein [Candidatus Omnitrophota bacterium]